MSLSRATDKSESGKENAASYIIGGGLGIITWLTMRFINRKINAVKYDMIYDRRLAR